MGTTLSSGLYKPDNLEAPGWGASERLNWDLLNTIMPQAFLVCHVGREEIITSLNISGIEYFTGANHRRLKVSYETPFVNAQYVGSVEAFKGTLTTGSADSQVGTAIAFLSGPGISKDFLSFSVQYKATTKEWIADPDDIWVKLSLYGTLES